VNVAVFGATSFIGQSLSEALVTHGHTVISFSRRVPASPLSISHRNWALGDRPEIDTNEEIDVAIHLAHDFTNPTGRDVTVHGTVSAVQACAASGVPRQLYFSSYSAHQHAVSEYGRTKYVIERILKGFAGVSIVRPGLVVGNGGVYLRIQQLSRRLPFIPTISGLDKVIPIIELDILINTIITIISNVTCAQEYNIFHNNFLSLHNLLIYTQEDASQQASHKCSIVIPKFLVIFIVKLALILNINFGISIDNVLGLLSNAASPHKSMWRH